MSTVNASAVLGLSASRVPQAGTVETAGGPERGPPWNAPQTLALRLNAVLGLPASRKWGAREKAKRMPKCGSGVDRFPNAGGGARSEPHVNARDSNANVCLPPFHQPAFCVGVGTAEAVAV